MTQPSLIIAAASLVVAFGLPAATQAKDKAVTTSSPGQATIAQKHKITATVEAIDVAKREITLKGPKGKVVPLSVALGDQIEAEYTQALAIAVEPPKK